LEIDYLNNICLELYTPDQWEIDKDSVTIDKLIGEGHFGQVYQGVLKLKDGIFKPCAVKVKTKGLFFSLFIEFDLATNNTSN
jgi:hypothetical protein